MKKRKASSDVIPINPLPSVETGGGHARRDTHILSAPAGLIPLIIDKCRERRFVMSMQMKLDSSLGAYVRSRLGWRGDLDEKERKRIAKEAADLIAQAEKGEGGTEIAGMVLLNLKAREPADARRKTLEKELEALVVQLPVWPWAKSIVGFGVGNLAYIVGETGDLSNYANPGKLWKRMGVALVDGARQGNPGKSATAEDWIKHGYVARRRSVLWKVGYCLITKQNDYRKLYLEQKAIYLAREGMTPMRANKMAKRYMEKRLLRELWKAWRAASEGVEPMSNLPPAPPDPKQPGATPWLVPKQSLPPAVLEAAD